MEDDVIGALIGDDHQVGITHGLFRLHKKMVHFVRKRPAFRIAKSMSDIGFVRRDNNVGSHTGDSVNFDHINRVINNAFNAIVIRRIAANLKRHNVSGRASQD
ncbi:Uncharacterised protein [Klebsiella pneumoniae]|nr:Uncharacterised protein [Klebsiella pneumoniae]